MTMLLLDSSRLDERRAAAAAKGPLAPLADSIAADLDVVMGRELYVPREKALLSRAGGRCETDGTQLEFDPFSPDEHRCPHCARVHTGDLHHRWWVYWYQLWLAERGVHAALLHLLRGDGRHGAFAGAVALRYCDMYAQYPNRDNVLGPTRLFFSTYLESIWLLQLCVMADLLQAAGDRAAADDIRRRIVQSSSALIAQYDEGMSNRQVWNNAAMMAAALVLGDRDAAARIVHAPSGVEAHLAHGVLDDGTWYEGENYHLFAHRGLWYCVVLAETAGIAIDARLRSRFQAGFAAPFATALPDFTLPSRKDSQYAISLRQPRFAELCELGLARDADGDLIGALARLYSTDVARGDTNRARSTADVERNLPATSLTRADLGWRSLLHARPELPPLHRAAPRSAHLAGQGITVFRREKGEVYVALDWGQSGGGHGHPDRLNVLFAQGGTRWLDDLGTGSYVDPSLHWYRSTLAHNAPLVGGHSQDRVDGRLLAHDERGSLGWVAAEAYDIAPGVHVTRAVTVASGYFIDEVRWSAGESVQFDLPVHFDGEPLGVKLTSNARLTGGDGLEDGFEFVRDASVAELGAGERVELVGTREGRTVRAFVCAAGASRLFRADAPGQPARQSRTFHLVRCAGREGVIRSVFAWSPRVSDVRFDGDGIEVSLGMEHHRHRGKGGRWTVSTMAGGVESLIELDGRVRDARSDAAGTGMSRQAEVETLAVSAQLLPRGTGRTFELGEEHYRRSEESWIEAGRPRATVSLRAGAGELLVDVSVAAAGVVEVPATATNPLDNEHPDINGHGVQLYVRTPGDGGAWMIVPEAGATRARVRPLAGWGSLEIRGAACSRTRDGFTVQARVALPPLPPDEQGSLYPLMIDVLVNETVQGRDRRRGQLVLSGAQGEFVYLRGDRHDPSRLMTFVIPDE